MGKKRNWILWAGFILLVAGVTSYIPFFALFPITRDFPWVNLLLLGAGGVLMGLGLGRAFRQPNVYRGRILGSIAAVLGLLAAGLFLFGLFYLGRLPEAGRVAGAGEKAPDFTLPDQKGKPVALAQLLSLPSEGMSGSKVRGALLIFYRGHW